MNRRDALARVALLMGTSIAGAEFFLSGCKTADKAPGLPLSKEDIAFLDEVAETIIPTTDTPGAKAAAVGAFMNTMVMDCYQEKEQKIFLDGISSLREACRKSTGKAFVEASPEERTTLLTRLDAEARKTPAEAGPHYFSLLKQLTLLGYFTSKIGCEQALRYVAVPGRYEGCIPYKKGDKAWAT